jgi:RNA polymerase sigma-70 factor (ECF subfamily)
MLDRQSVVESQTQLLCRIAAKDKDALAVFYDQTAGLLYSLAVRILEDPHEAEEVIQDVFVQIWRKAVTFDATVGTPSHWALSITRNRSIDRLRARHRRFRLMYELREAADADSGPDEPPGHAGMNQEDIAVLRSALNGLPNEQRQAIEMAFFGGMTHLEIAGALREPLGTIKARIRRGMLKLRECLEISHDH